MRPGTLTIIEFPLTDNLEVSNPERLALKFEGEEALAHIWTFAYLTRRKRIGKPADWPIDEASLSPPRLKVIMDLVRTLSQIMKGKGLSPASMRLYYQTLVKFMDWLDESNRGQFIWVDRNLTEAAILEFCEELVVDVANEAISTNSVAGYQARLLEFAREFYDENMCRGFKAVSQTKRAPTRVPDENALKEFRGCMDAVFDIASKTTIQLEPFPVKFSMPVGETTRTVWHFPNRRSANTMSSVRGAAAWDARTGELRSIEELKLLFDRQSNPSTAAHAALRSAKRVLGEANSQKYHPERLSLASFGCLAFAALFALETGLNQAVLEDLDYSESQREDLKGGAVTRARYRGLKFRAKGKEVSATVSLRFFPYLQRYFDLRDYVMQGKACTKLFVFVNSNGDGAALSSGWYKTSLKRRVKRLGVAVPLMGLRKIRAGKQDYLIRHATPEVAAALMGHSVSTALRSYSNGSEAQVALEMGDYLDGLEESVIKIKEGQVDEMESGVGKCVDYGNPIPIVAEAPVDPNCDRTEGCLFCAKYKIHADEIDIRKLLSCRYVLKETFGINGGEDVIDQVLHRIEFLLGELKKVDAELVERVRCEVENDENLDSFWAAKLEQLAVLGVI